jgi:hypothetical protein
MSGVQPTIIDYQGIKIENTTLDKSVTLTMDGNSQGFILDYDKLTANPKKFTITDNGINFTDNTNNDTTSLERLALVEDLFPAAEIPENSTTLQINKSLLLNDNTNNVTAKLDLGNTGNLTMDACGNLILNPFGSILTNGKNINSGGGEIQNCNLVNSQTNSDIIIEGKGTGDVILKTDNTNRLTISDTGSWTCQGGMSYNNETNNLTATTFTGTATRFNVSTDNTDTTMYPVFVSGTGGRPFLIDSGTGPLTYNPFTGVMSFPGVPTCTTSATTNNQLVNWQNFSTTSFSPIITASGGGSPAGYIGANTDGAYILINKLCIGQAEIHINGLGSLSGDVRVSIPVACSSNVPASLTIGLMNGMGTNDIINFSLTADTSASFARLQARNTSTTASYRNLTISEISASFRIRYSFAYITS